MVKMTNIIVSDLSFDSKDEYDIIRSNISFINLLLEEGADEELVYEDAFLSYYVDYYDSEYKNGDFSQYVYNSGWNTVINDMVAKGLAKIGATEHLIFVRWWLLPKAFPTKRCRLSSIANILVPTI